MVDAAIIKTAEQYLHLVSSEFQVKRSYLFGSYAKEMQKEESDIDIALVLENMPDFFDTQRLLRKIRRQIDLRIEPHPIAEDQFNPQNPFAAEIQRTGIELRVR